MADYDYTYDTRVTTGSTVNFTLNALIDGAIWNLTGAAVTLVLTNPMGVDVTRNAPVINAPDGVARYTSPTTELNMPGTWGKKWKVVQGAVTLWSRSIPLEVYAGG